ncbi:helix-turn-helix transcriptional regulator [Cohnella zeiphila]|uniref:AraC family transcriptional regulator n=1 Tax=Cohnella zeiphila TaxID=2761120 RepID=A0A7X0VX17_9BACL|nr:AraC family transcriptional regulator [Cohnella zeiphila]MBB6733551.1 AraC family transcriptional regulator [Cohnella zeiphila]
MGTPTYSVNLNSGGGELTVRTAGFQSVLPGGMLGTYPGPNYRLNFIESGQAEYGGEWGKIGLGEGDCFIVPPSRYIVARTTAPTFFRFVTFEGRAAEAELSRIGFSSALPVFRAMDRTETAMRFEKIHLLLQDKTAHYDFIAEAYLRLLLVGLAGRNDPPEKLAMPLAPLSSNMVNRHIRAVVEWMSACFDLPLTVRELAQKAGYSERYFRKAFRRATGLSPTELLTRIRMDRAMLLLLQPLSVKQIALTVGYRDPLYFSKLFRQRTGLSPSDYREHSKERSAAEAAP